MSEYLPGLEGVPATQSNISDLDGLNGVLTYRGYRIADLAVNSTFEETSLLLLDGHLPTYEQLESFDNQLRANRIVKYNVREIMKYLPATGHPMEMLQTAIAAMGMFYKGSKVLTDGYGQEDEYYVHSMSVKIIARVATIVAAWQHVRNGYDPINPRRDLNHSENFMYMMTGLEPDPLDVLEGVASRHSTLPLVDALWVPLELERDAAQGVRLAYVAATRARKSLHLFGHCTFDKKTEEPKPVAGSLLATLWPAVADAYARLLPPPAREDDGMAVLPRLQRLPAQPPLTPSAAH